ncbi:MAG TPA: hypothetical protein VGT98_06230 [Candidatus Elarobacter sp.]|nr:hypothetical protein [Candidatus Elarobacter sp.]HEV2738676.1 hypothetical protein [Candidatus Elarobacter sp.]
MAKTAVDEPIAYEQRLILFLDFLGFKEIVEETTTDPKHLARLLQAIDFLSQLKPDEADGGKQVTQFSDSVVVSYPVSAPSSVFILAYEVALLIIDLAYAGFLVRGAITLGLLIHNDEYLVGPAMIRAYQMESREAKNPRVVIDPRIVKIARAYSVSQNSSSEEVDYVRGVMGAVRDLMTKDDDGRFFFDYISWNSVVDEARLDTDRYGSYLANIGRLVERGLRNKDPHVKEKYLWLHKRYVASIDEILRQPDRSKWYQKYRDVAAAVKDLPKYKVLARNAERVVAAAAGKA